MKSKTQGMSLVELMVVLVIIGFLSAIIIPSYQKYIYKAKRQKAQSDLYKLQIWLEQQYTATASYPTSLNCQACQLSDSYNFAVSVKENNSGYQITAVPKASSTQQKDKCYTQVLDHLSMQSSLDKEGNPLSNIQCWK